MAATGRKRQGDSPPSAVKKPKQSENDQTASQPVPPPDPKKVAEMLAQAKRQVEERRERLKKNRPLPGGGGGAAAFGNAEDLAKRRRMEEAKKRAASSSKVALLNNRAVGDQLDRSNKRGLEMDVHPLLQAAEPSTVKPQLVPSLTTQARIPGFLDKRRGATTAKTAVPKERLNPEDNILSVASTPFFDANLAGGKYADARANKLTGRQPRGQLRFVSQGKYIAQATKLRAEAKMEQIRRSIAERVQKTGLEDELDMVGDGAVVHDPVPDVEWWDLNFLLNKSYSDLCRRQIKIDGLITPLVQHPVPIEPIFEAPITAQSVILTTRERKKARRLRRLEEQKEKREKIRLGLLPPEQPKVKISNLMRVLGNEAVQDPTMIEKQVREEMARRLDKHERENTERKLTDEQRSAKNIRKHTEDTSLKVQVAVFRVRDLSHPSHRFKVDMNAQQHHLTGVCVLHGNTNLVVVEGGPKGIQKYKNLMLRRINWDDKVSENDNEGDEDGGTNTTTSNECLLVWEGLKPIADFRGFRFRQCPTEQKVKEALGENCLTYWDLARSFKPTTA